MKRRERKRFFFWAVACLALISIGGNPAMAAEYPSKPITLYIPYSAGGSTDLVTRPLAGAAKKYLGQPVICENKPGGGATVALSLLVNRLPDGYTIGLITSAAATSWHMGKLDFNPMESFTYIIHFARYMYGIVVRSDAQWKTLQELIQYIKENPQKLSYATSGVGIPGHLAMEELIALTGIQCSHVPYKGTAEINSALLGGHVDFMSDASGWTPLVDSGNFRLLATWGYQRSARYPNAPTVKELGYNVATPGPLGIIAPKGMPKSIVKKLHDSFQKAMDDPDFQAALKKFDMDKVYMNTEDYEKFSHEDYARLEKIITKLGLRQK